MDELELLLPLVQMLLVASTGLRSLSENKHPKLVREKLQGLVSNLKWKLEDVCILFNSLRERFVSMQSGDEFMLLPWMLHMLHRIEVNHITAEWRDENKKTLTELIQNYSLTDEELKARLAFDRDKTLEEILEEIRADESNQVDERLLGRVRDVVSSVERELRLKGAGSDLTGLENCLLRICRAAEAAHFRPRLTQMVSWCIMALSEKGRLLQVRTGEGKTCVVAMFAAYRAMSGEKVDVMSSSPVLAQRDVKKWKKFYEQLGISVDCNINREVTDLTRCYQSDVVYGTVSEFAGDWLRQRFQRMETFGQRGFGCAIVDEVDDLLLDKGNQTVYLSSEMPALQHLSPLLAFIWATVNRLSRGAASTCHDESSLRTAAEEEIRRSLRYTPCEVTDTVKFCYVPGFLSDLVEAKLKVWIGNAFHAQELRLDCQYTCEAHGIVPVDYTSTGVVQNFMTWSDGLHQFLEMKHNLKLSDMTAVTNYMSNVGLLQHYQGRIYGMSGTLGKRAETQALQQIYKGIQTCKIPTSRRRKLFEVQGLVVKEEEEWVRKICEAVTEQITPTEYRGRRAVLVICETIKQAKRLHGALGERVPEKKCYINNNMDNSKIFAEKLPGEVVVATNLAGRGLDLKMAEAVKEAGGLFVLQTFLPRNARVEAQAFGRAARGGCPGSAQLIVCLEHLSKPQRALLPVRKLSSLLEGLAEQLSRLQQLLAPSLKELNTNSWTEQTRQAMRDLLRGFKTSSESDLQAAKDVRDDSVAEVLSRYVKVEIPKLKKDEELFNLYLDVQDEHYKTSSGETGSSDVAALNEYWGLWRLTRGAEEQPIDTLKSKLREDLRAAVQEIKKGRSPLSNLHHHASRGNDLQSKGALPKSVREYTAAIQQDSCWAALAFYNRAFASLMQQNENQDPERLEGALRDLQRSLKSLLLYTGQLELMGKCVEKQKNQSSQFHRHLATRLKVWGYLRDHIVEVTKTVEKAVDYGGKVKVEHSSIYLFLSIRHYLPAAFNLIKSMPDLYRGNPLINLQLFHHDSFHTLNELARLSSMGLPQIYVLDSRFSMGGFLSAVGRKVFDFFSGRRTASAELS